LMIFFSANENLIKLRRSRRSLPPLLRWLFDVNERRTNEVVRGQELPPQLNILIMRNSSPFVSSWGGGEFLEVLRLFLRLALVLLSFFAQTTMRNITKDSFKYLDSIH
jgi:hypothetical protein